MEWYWWLFLGLAIGWGIEWVIDWLYWRQRSAGSSADLENLRAQNKRLRVDLDAANATQGKLKAELDGLHTRVADAESVSGTLRAQVDATNSTLGSLRAELDGANGSLAAARDESARLRARLNIDSGVLANLNNQLVQAQGDLASLRADNNQLRAQVEGAAALTVGGSAPAGNQYKTQLMNIADLNLAENLGQPGDELARLRGDLADANGELDRLRAELAGLRGRPVRDPLIDINGIGPVIEKRLFEAGIYTFEQLAAEAPERLREIARLQDWQDADPAAWVAEALDRAAAKNRS